MQIVAVDVGNTAGIAIKLGSEYLTSTEVTPENVWHLVADNEWDVVIYENFATSFHISKYGLYTVRLIGGIQAICMLKSTKCIGQQPQYRKAFQQQAHTFLKRLNRSFMVHEEDALAHLFAFEHYRDLQESNKGN